jgi:hypothetical protein
MARPGHDQPMMGLVDDLQLVVGFQQVHEMSCCMMKMKTRRNGMRNCLSMWKFVSNGHDF